MTNFRPFPPMETYAKLILLIKDNFYHKMNFLQRLETKSPRGLLGCDFGNLGMIFKICKILTHLPLLFFKSFHFWLFIIQNSLYTNFQKFPVKSQIFLHINLVPIMYEPWKLKKVTGNKFLFRVILERCGPGGAGRSCENLKTGPRKFTIFCPLTFFSTILDSKTTYKLKLGTSHSI